MQNVYRILDNSKISEHNKIRIVLLYSLRYCPRDRNSIVVSAVLTEPS